MLKKILTVLSMFYAFAAFAAVDVNKATAADLDGIKGIGPAVSGNILDERKKGNFKDWPDLITRVKGVGEGNAAKFSTEGLTVNGSAFAGAAPAMKKDEKPAKVDPKPAAMAAAPAAAIPAPAAAAAPAAKLDAKAQAKADKEAAMKAKADEKAAKEAAAKDAKADAAKSAASAPKK